MPICIILVPALSSTSNVVSSFGSKILTLPLTVNALVGVDVPMPTNPLPRIERAVEVAKLLVEVEMVKIGVVCPGVPAIEKFANGELVPTPTFPELLLKMLLPERVHGVLMVKPDPPTSAPGVPEKVTPVPAVIEEVAAKARAVPAEFEYRSELLVKEERPVPPLRTESVPVR